jgi:hypothetical protein
MATRKRLHFCSNDGIMQRLPRPDVSFLYPTMSNTFLLSSFSHGDIASWANCGCAKAPYYDCKRVPVTSNHDEWKDSHTMSVWVTISNAVWGWSKYWACYWICNSDGIMEYDFPFSCGAPTTEYCSMNYASSIIYVFARSDLINFCQAHNEVVICNLVTNVLRAVAPVWMNRACAKPWTKDTNKCRSVGTITYFLGPSLPHSATIAKRIESVKL